MRRAAEDGAGAVFHQNEIRDIDRQLPVRIERVQRPDAGVEAHLLGGVDLGLRGAAAPALLDERGEFGIFLRRRRGERMIRRDRHEFRAEQRVRPRGEDFQLAFAVRRGCRIEREAHQQALGAADPVLLHQPDFFRPAVERVERVEQLLGELRDLEEPLRQLALLDQRAGAPAAAVDHLLVGEHGLIDRIPVHLRLAAARPGRRAENRGTSSAGACNRPDRRSRSRGSSRATVPSISVAPSSPRCSRRSTPWDGPCAPWRRSRPACRRRPSPSDAARQSPSPASPAPPRRPSCSCARGPYGCAPTDRGTSPARSISACPPERLRAVGWAWRRCRARPRFSASGPRPRRRCSGR